MSAVYSAQRASGNGVFGPQVYEPSGAANATGALAGNTLVGITGTATGKATATTTPAAITLVAATASASTSGGGVGNAFAAFMEVVLTPITGLGTGKATALCDMPALSLVAVTGTAIAFTPGEYVPGAMVGNRPKANSIRMASGSTSRPSRIASTTR